MVKVFLLTLLALLGGLLLAIYLARDPGYLLIAYGQYTFETSLFALLVALIFLLLVVKLILLLLGWLNPLQVVRKLRKSN